jgi:hypothetical protein
MATNIHEHIDVLRKAYSRNDLVLYLGAGVSIPNGLPSWDKLVLSMYFSSNKQIFNEGNIRPFPNYLFAISEWMMKEKNEPLDILVRKLKRNVGEDEFMQLLTETLYAGFKTEDPYLYGAASAAPYQCDSELVLEANATLKSITELCREKDKGVKTIITYNYDNLLELGLQKVLGDGNYFVPIYQKGNQLKEEERPIYHVHGYIPIPDSGLPPSGYNEIILSEESYHRTAQDAYYWGNMVQMQHLSNNTGLMIGMSLSDRNIRRILDSLKSTPIKTHNFLITQKPKKRMMDGCDQQFVRQKAEEYLDKFEKSGRKVLQMKTDFTVQRIADIISHNEIDSFEEDFQELGLDLIWFDEFDEIPAILQEIAH